MKDLILKSFVKGVFKTLGVFVVTGVVTGLGALIYTNVTNVPKVTKVTEVTTNEKKLAEMTKLDDFCKKVFRALDEKENHYENDITDSLVINENDITNENNITDLLVINENDCEVQVEKCEVEVDNKQKDDKYKKLFTF